MSLSGPYLFDPEDFWGDENVLVMTVHQVYAYKRLLGRQWQNGSIPACPARIAALISEGPRQFAAADVVGDGDLDSPAIGTLWDSLRLCFEYADGDPSRLVNPRMDYERDAWIEKKTSQSEGGKKGAMRRWKSQRKAKRQKDLKGSDSSAMGNPSVTQAEPNGLYPSPSPSPSPSPKEGTPQTPHGGARLPPVPDWAKTAAKRTGIEAAELCSAVCRCIQEVHRKGVNPQRAKTSADPVLKLWRALGRPPLEEFERDYRLVARAAHDCPDGLFARDIRGKGWEGQVDRSHDVATISVQKRWDERLEVARLWEARRLPAADPPPDPYGDPPPAIKSKRWEGVLKRARAELDPEDFGTWFGPARAVAESNGTLTVWVPNEHFRQSLQANWPELVAGIEFEGG